MNPGQVKKPTESAVYDLVLGKIIATLREQRGWTQGELAARVGVTQSTLSRIERGQASPDPYTFRKFAEVFDLGVEEFNRRVDEAMDATKRATQGVTEKAGGSTPWWEVAVGVAGVVGLVGLVTFAVAAILDEEKPPAPDRPGPDAPNTDASKTAGDSKGRERHQGA